MIPINEKGVEYLFYRNHEKLGFEKIKKLQGGFPDIIAYKNGVEVGIELEYRLSSLLYHYYLDPIEIRFTPKYRGYYWEKRDQYWVRVFSDNSFEKNYFDPMNRYTLTKNGGLIFKTLNDRCQFVIYWIKDFNVTDTINLINLNEVV